MAVTTEQFTRLEDRVNDTTASTNELKGAYERLATEVDVERVRTEVEKVRTDIAKASLTQIRWLIGVVAVPTILGLINLIIQFTTNTGAKP